MEMSVNSYLTTLASELVLSPAEESSINTSISTLSARLDRYFGGNIDKHFRFGSSTRGTILPRSADARSDIDYMVIFNTSDGQRKPQTYLDRLRTFAEKQYQRSDVYQSTPTLVLSLNHIRFELVPAIENYGYYIPSPSSSWLEWIQTDPIGTNAALTDKNVRHGSKIKPLVRLIKYWNATKDRPFASFSIEMDVVSRFFINCNTLWDYLYDYWSSFSCTYSTPQYIKDYVESAQRRVRKAREYERSGYLALAEAEIKKVVPPL